MIQSKSVDALIEKAAHCYELGLIDTSRLEYVTQCALTVPGYNPVRDLPFPWEIEKAEKGQSL